MRKKGAAFMTIKNLLNQKRLPSTSSLKSLRSISALEDRNDNPSGTLEAIELKFLSKFLTKLKVKLHTAWKAARTVVTQDKWLFIMAGVMAVPEAV
ncbi:hypothetical protein BGX26_005551, partial [Mortierella sp. AD094]